MSQTSSFDNAILGEGNIIEPNVVLGYRYVPGARPAKIGKQGIFRYGALVYGDVVLGDYFQLGHYAVIRAKVRAGNYCALGNHSCLEGIVRMGDGVRIMSKVYIPTRTWIGSNVFIGPGVTFLNSRTPGREGPRGAVRGATVEDEVMIGGGVTVMAGVTIGYRSFIAAGTVISRDIPPRSMVRGTRAEIMPLPEKADRDNDRWLTTQTMDLWHPHMDPAKFPKWPADWPDRFEDYSG